MDKKTRGGAGRGQGRKPIKAGEKTVSISFRGTEAQRERFKALGGGEWVRDLLDAAKWPKAPADREAAQAAGKHTAPCARFCEANAFEIELRSLRRENERLRAQIMGPNA